MNNEVKPTPPAPQQAPADARLASMEATKRILTSISCLLDEGMFTGANVGRIQEAKAYVRYLTDQADGLVKNLREEARAEKKAASKSRKKA